MVNPARWSIYEKDTVNCNCKIILGRNKVVCPSNRYVMLVFEEKLFVFRQSEA